ncbi:MAG: NAD(P)-dependent oxidoreductase [Bacteroidales bacterium]|nr:NAD(P)-dependent oxidoreductase [Bacteroidales bacterium]
MKIVCVEPIGISYLLSESLKEKFEKSGHEFMWYYERREDSKNLIQRMHDAEIVIISNIKLDAKVLAACPKLKMLSVAFTGLDHIDLDYCKAHNITVINASGYATIAVAELAVGLMLDVYRRITALDAETRKSGIRNNFLGRELHGKTVGIIGTGAIGQETARLLQAFGCKVVAWSRTQRPSVKASGIEYVALDDLLKMCDIISLHVPFTAETFHLISAEKLALCKSSAILINTARGNVVDMNALAVALRNEKLAGAGIDVFEKEPPLPPDHPLLQSPNCVVVPHIGYATREAFDIRIDIVIDHIWQWLETTK